MRQFDLPLRIKRASEGKEAANECVLFPHTLVGCGRGHEVEV
jgi:hypothetical protein